MWGQERQLQLSAYTPPFPGRAEDRLESLCVLRSLNSSLTWELPNVFGSRKGQGSFWIVLIAFPRFPKTPSNHSVDIQLSV